MAMIGIDLGTTNSLVSVYRNGRAELLPNELGQYMTPAVSACWRTAASRWEPWQKSG